MKSTNGVDDSSREQYEVNNANRRKWNHNEVVGLILVVVSLVVLLVKPSALSDLFESIIQHVFPIVVGIFLTSEVGIAIIVSVIVGRVLERLGFTDGLIRIFVPIIEKPRCQALNLLTYCDYVSQLNNHLTSRNTCEVVLFFDSEREAGTLVPF